VLIVSMYTVLLHYCHYGNADCINNNYGSGEWSALLFRLLSTLTLTSDWI